MQLNLVPGSKESEELKVLSTLIEEYETEHFPINLQLYN